MPISSQRRSSTRMKNMLGLLSGVLVGPWLTAGITKPRIKERAQMRRNIFCITENAVFAAVPGNADQIELVQGAVPPLTKLAWIRDCRTRCSIDRMHCRDL